MRTTFSPALNAHLTLDDEGRVRQINHVGEQSPREEKDARQAAINYLRQVADVFRVPRAQLDNVGERVSYLQPRPQDVEYRLAREKQLFDSTTLEFDQTYLNVPVWRAGFSVTVKHAPFRVVHAVNTSREGLDAELPPENAIQPYRVLFSRAAADSQTGRPLENADESGGDEAAAFIHGLIDRGKLQSDAEGGERREAGLIRGRFYVYRYDEKERLPPTSRQRAERRGAVVRVTEGRQNERRGEEEEPPVLPLPPVAPNIVDGRHYLVAEITFSYATAEHGRLNWLALVEVETDSVLYLRALADNQNGMVFIRDPITATGDATNTSDQGNAVLNPLRTSVPLPNLDAPVGGVQSLRGTRANLTNKHNPNVAAPTEPGGTDFNYDARTNDFAAVNAYYHVDRLIATIESLGFTIATYFDGTTMPIAVDHRCYGTATNPQGNVINAHCVGNGMGGIDHVGYALSDLTDTANPLGRACDSRVTWHELGGHGVLYEHVNFANFGFSHSAGDSLSVIFHDPDSQAPDRFRYSPWNPSNTRRCDRGVAEWAWGGPVVLDGSGNLISGDDGGYGSEEILETTLFRVYRSIGGDSTSLSRRQFASRMMLYLILRAIGTLTPATNPNDALDFANALIAVDLLNWTSEGLFGGAYNKVIRWSFEKQGLYQAPGAPTPVTTEGQPPDVDVYIDDGRHGEYPFQAVHWHNTSIWNRREEGAVEGHEEPALGETNYAYVKIKNRGTQQAQNVRVRGYHCLPSAGVLWPNDLQPFTTAEIAAGTLDPNNTEEKIVGPFHWTPVINAYGHDCMLMIVSADGDPSNADNFEAGESIADWRLVPNDNNIGQRNVQPVAGGESGEGLMASLDGLSFWVGNPNPKAAEMKLSVVLPGVLAEQGWRLTFKGVEDNVFRLGPGEKREVFMTLHRGRDFEKSQVEKSADRDIIVTVTADDMLIGGMTYRLDPEIKAPYNKRGAGGRRGCLGWLVRLLRRLFGWARRS